MAYFKEMVTKSRKDRKEWMQWVLEHDGPLIGDDPEDEDGEK